MNLPDRLIACHEGLAGATIPHAFGGAIALAYATLDPRGTSDIDINVFVPAERCEPALEALPEGVDVGARTAEEIARDGQARIWWDRTPIDLFFDYVPIHEQAARNARMVPFAGSEIPVLGPVELAVFKAMFDRTRDWADIEAMVSARSLDVEAVREGLRAMVPDDDHRFARLTDAVRLGAGDGSDPGLA